MSEERGFCDLVMQGGLTSGIVYPPAVLELARKYNFKNIGGTSAGAIAAAAAAAAEVGRRRFELDKTRSWSAAQRAGIGMTGLASISNDLTSPGFILNLFQPEPKVRPAFDLVVTLGGKRSPGGGSAKQANGRAPASWSALCSRAALAIRTIVRISPIWFTLSFLVPLGLAACAFGPMWPDAMPGKLLVILTALVFAAMSFAVSLAISAAVALGTTADAMRRNFMGLCSGQTVARCNKGDGLTDWMHRITCDLAGKPAADPVVFGDLWNAPAYEHEPAGKTVNLAMITTDASHQQPRTLPAMSPDFWYCEEEFARLFPPSIMAALAADNPPSVTLDGRTFHAMPSEDKLPIVVAARMSLSFPMLISAVPLYQPDRGNRILGESSQSAPDKTAAGPKMLDDLRPAALLQSVDALAEAGKPVTDASTGGALAGEAPTAMLQCWFTDGGASSNFPLDLFDAPIPRWPTFAVDLVYKDVSLTVPTDGVFLPTVDRPPTHPRYVDLSSPSALAQIGGFLFSVVATMQNWRDSVQGRAAGQRDRIVSIFLDPDEGGLNLNMAADMLKSAARKGDLAGKALVGQFNFANHCQIRSRVVMASTEEFVQDLELGLTGPITPTGPMEPPEGPYPFTPDQQAVHSAREQEIHLVAVAWSKQETLKAGAPQPPLDLRVTPTF